MKMHPQLVCAMASLCLLALPGPACADTDSARATGINAKALDLHLPRSAATYTPASETYHARPYMLALNAVDEMQQKEHEENLAAEAEANKPVAPPGYKPPLFTRSSVHQYLGLATIAGVMLTAVTAPDNEGNNAHPKSGLHQTLGRTTALLATTTVATGLYAHWNDIHLDDGIYDPDIQHALLGTAGALAMLAAISRAPNGGHAAMGITGGVAMAVAIKLTW